MESKTKHRILGLVVVAGLAILMYPFMLGNNGVPAEKALVKAPPFPDQATQVVSVDPSEDVIGMPDPAEQPVTASAQPDQQPETAANQDASNAVNIAEQQQTAAAAPAEVPTAAVEPAMKSEVAAEVKADAPEVNAAEKPVELVAPLVDAKPADPKHAKIKAIQKKIAGKSVKKLVNARGNSKASSIHARMASHSSLKSYRNAPIGNNGLLELKQAAYVIQLGSFNQKANALKLVNKLRANGYRAFIQNVQASSGSNTRVFVGPEHRQASARQVASRLAKDMNLRGIVISYQPFTL